MYLFKSLDSKLNFGKHKGKTLAAVCQLSPSYIQWMLRTVEFVAMSRELMIYLNEEVSGVNIPEDLLERVDEAYQQEMERREKRSMAETMKWDDDPGYDDRYDSFDHYGGPSVGEGDQMSDGFIDDVLDGDPSNYMNID